MKTIETTTAATAAATADISAILTNVLTEAAWKSADKAADFFRQEIPAASEDDVAIIRANAYSPALRAMAAMFAAIASSEYPELDLPATPFQEAADSAALKYAAESARHWGL